MFSVKNKIPVVPKGFPRPKPYTQALIITNPPVKVSPNLPVQIELISYSPR